MTISADLRKTAEKPPFLGFGLGLRPQHYTDILEGGDTLPIDWFEVISENYMLQGGRPIHMLDRIRERYPVVMHGVSLSIASTQPLNMEYLAGLKSLAERVEPKWISDHLCWTGVHGVNLHDLIPIPYTEEALNHVVSRIEQVQDYLGRRIAIENVSSYVEFAESEMEEWEFVAELARRADCWLLLDVNNVFVSGQNHAFDDAGFVEAIPADRVVQFHLAGHSEGEDCLIDTHDQPVCDEVFELYGKALERFGPVSTMIERDDNIPPLAELLEELARARSIAGQVLPAASLQTAA
ncbi:MNIO family bufferin maturase [Salaquimonas pukyongi]|uniref:MNIO family bufferin maturase n=1 Tax=Salaquimonas pukyongi TaxID=2712698 RepID=UPI00096B9296|nr:DUF692 domain-containing protein [Salaquimonas pukyongi]